MAAPPCAKCIKARPGQRVVRGPDWSDGNHDGGSDYVGTILSVHQPGTASGYTTHPVAVQWDAGPVGWYMANCPKNKCALRLIDAGPAGVIFPNTTCGSCEANDVAGTLWKCAVCTDYSLCHSCYMNDKHNVEHEFLRYDDRGLNGFRVPPRKQSAKVPFYGIFHGAEVQSRNGVKTGIVRNIRGEVRLLRKTDAGKLCSSNTGKVDDSLKFVKAAQGGCYYRDHMPLIASPGHDPKDMDLFQRNKKPLSAGDLIRVISDPKKLERYQKRISSYVDGLRIRRWCGREGRVGNSYSDGSFYVNDKDSFWYFLPVCLIPINNTPRIAINYDISTGCKGLGYGPSKMTALHVACYSGEEEVVRTLVMAGADLEEADVNSDRALHYAAASGQSRIIEVLLDSGVDIGACNMFSETCLHVAIKENSVGCARLLAKNIKDSEINIQDSTGDTVLHSAINRGMQEEIIMPLLQVPTVGVALKNDKGETPLHIAASKANLWATQQILQNRTDIVDEKNKQNLTALCIAVDHNLYEIAKILITQGHCNVNIQCGSSLKTALATAVARGFCDLVELLLESGADINAPDSEGNASLHLCVKNTQPLILSSSLTAPKMSLMKQNLQEANSQLQLNGLAMAGLLASKGGDLQQKNKEGLTPPQLCDSMALVETFLFWNTQERATGRYSDQLLSDLVNAKDKKGMVLLHREAMSGRHQIAQMLLEQGYTPVDTVCEEGLKTALSIAVERGHCKLVQVLIEAGADVNKQDAKGNAPLHISVTSHHCEIVELLLAAGADVNKQDANGNTPLHISLMSPVAVKASNISSAVAPKLKAIATELEKMKHGDIDASLALACLLISSGSSLSQQNAQRLNPLNIAGTMAVVRTLLKWVPKIREPPAEEVSVERSAEDDATGDEGAATSTERIGAPGPSDEEANCRSAKKRPKEEEIDDRHTCAICMERERTVAFLCGHGACQECATKIKRCHVCRARIKKRIKLFEC